jgi:hypothetical protein
MFECERSQAPGSSVLAEALTAADRKLAEPVAYDPWWRRSWSYAGLAAAACLVWVVGRAPDVGQSQPAPVYAVANPTAAESTPEVDEASAPVLLANWSPAPAWVEDEATSARTWSPSTGTLLASVDENDGSLRVVRLTPIGRVPNEPVAFESRPQRASFGERRPVGGSVQFSSFQFQR